MAAEAQLGAFLGDRPGLLRVGAGVADLAVARLEGRVAGSRRGLRRQRREHAAARCAAAGCAHAGSEAAVRAARAMQRAGASWHLSAGQHSSRRVPER